VSDSDTQAAPEDRWRCIDALLAGGNLDGDSARRALIEEGLVRKGNGLRLPDGRGEFWMLEPARERLVPGPRILLTMGAIYGGPRLYRPVRDLMLVDTGAFSGPVPGRNPAEGSQ
jgi:hypothetical protein